MMTKIHHYASLLISSKRNTKWITKNVMVIHYSIRPLYQWYSPQYPSQQHHSIPIWCPFGKNRFGPVYHLSSKKPVLNGGKPDLKPLYFHQPMGISDIYAQHHSISMAIHSSIRVFLQPLLINDGLTTAQYVQYPSPQHHRSMGISGSNRWRSVSTICLAIFSGDIPWNLGLKNRPNIYGIGTSNQSVPEMAIE